MSTMVNTLQSAGTSREVAEATYRKVSWRLLPLLFVCYVLNYADRINIGYAQLQMKQDLGFTDAVYGLAAGIFFLGYFLFEVPSNLFLERFGVRKTLLRIMVLWGLASSATMFVQTPTQFYVVRFVLGVFEAGFFPGIVLYLTYWYPPARRAKVVAIFMLATVVAGIITGPVSGYILHGMADVLGLRGWQWMFLLEGMPSVLMGIVAFVLLRDRPETAEWLTERERIFIAQELASTSREVHSPRSQLAQVLRDPRVYLLSFIAFTVLCGAYVISFWLPSMIRGLGVSDLRQVGLLSAIPYLVGAVAMVFVGRHSDKTRERRRHFLFVVALAAIGLAATTITSHSVALSIAMLSLAAAGCISSLPVFWAMTTAILPGASASVSIAAIASLSNLAGLVSPYVIGAIKTSTGTIAPGLYVFAALLLLGGVLAVALVPRESK